MAASTTIERDHGFLRIRRELKAISGKGAHVAVGIFGGTKPGGDSVLAYSLANEFGVPSGNYGQTVPARPFVSRAGDKNRGKYRRMLRESFDVIIRGGSARGALEVLGLEAVKDIRDTIDLVQAPPLKQSTIDRKRRTVGGGGSKPLINTGTMKKSVVHEVRGL